ncbi:MAG TPA: radical SAM protein [Vicinamibacterales bacterium]|nr:radical SAM protein [Vicinamibacterales bacterium]
MFVPPNPLSSLTRGARMLASVRRPLLVQLVVTRRCNLSCGYCSEYDDVSPPVETALLERRIDHIAQLGTLIVTLTGGEPLLHPKLDQLIARVASHGMVCTLISNGYPLTKEWIRRLNQSKLSLLQMSVDNMEPNEFSQKSWSQIRKKLELLREHATFSVNINAVLGSSNLEQTRQVVAGVRELGFFMTVGLMHDARGQIEPGLLRGELAQTYEEMQRASNKTVFHRTGEGWERDMLEDGSSPFKCRAGGRYLYVDEFGKVNYCSQRRGEPGTDLLSYGADDVEREFYTPKGCEAQCTIGCVRRASAFDGWRAQPGA